MTPDPGPETCPDPRRGPRHGQRRFRHGLVLGKFYPPHAGHHYLVRTAQERCDHVTVLVCAASVESIPLGERVRWMAEVHGTARVEGVVDDIPVDLVDPAVWDAHMEIFRAGVAYRPTPVDAVFTSEEYGAELARRFGAQHVGVDPGRTRYPVSGTAVRRDPVAHWDMLATPVRAWLARRVVVLGAESTGTTTMARALAAHYRSRGGVWSGARWVPEYGREHSAQKLAGLRRARPGADWADVTFTPDEFPVIARRQNRRENRAARGGAPVLFCDTDAFATTLWYERYLGGTRPRPAGLAELADANPHHLYLLTDHTDVPFEEDGLRAGPELRPWMTSRFCAELERTGRPFRLLSGGHEERLKTAVAAVDELLARGWGLADPLPERRTPADPVPRQHTVHTAPAPGPTAAPGTDTAATGPYPPTPSPPASASPAPASSPASAPASSPSPAPSSSSEGLTP